MQWVVAPAAARSARCGAGTGRACRLHRAGGLSLRHSTTPLLHCSTTIATHPRCLQSAQCVQCSSAPFPSPRTIVTGGAPSLTASATRYEVTLSSAADDGRLGDPSVALGRLQPTAEIRQRRPETNGGDLRKRPTARRHAAGLDGVLAWAGGGALPASSKHAWCRRDRHRVRAWRAFSSTHAAGTPIKHQAILRVSPPYLHAKQLGDPLLCCFSPLFAP